MISDFFQILYDNIIALLAAILPTSGGLPTEVQDGIEFFIEKLFGFSYIIPANDLILILKTFVLFEAAVLFFRMARYFLGLVRGGS